MATQINTNTTLYELVNTYEEASDLLKANGFLLTETLLNGVGKTLTLDMALKSRKINQEVFIKQLVANIDDNQKNVDVTLKSGIHKNKAEVQLQGILPCPVRVPLLESFDSWLLNQPEEFQKKLGYELKAASMGVDWLKADLMASKGEEDLADIFLSAGFDLFFDKALLGKYKEQKTFADYMPFSHYNRDFENEEIQLKDPSNEYSMIGVVPAVFLVNKNELNGRKMPLSWADILKPEFENSVSLPVGDFDLFNAILLNIYKLYGEEGVKALKRSFYINLHPSEMVKSHSQKVKPAVTIMPYFFTKMTRGVGPMEPVWPNDGAIISPIFMLTKASKKEKLQPIVDFFSSKEVGEILSHNGRFPSIHPEVDNMIPKENKYMWLGWSYIESHDIAQLIAECTELFEAEPSS